MGILEKNKKLTKTPFNSSNIKNIQKNGNKKAYSLNYQNEKQVKFNQFKFRFFFNQFF